MRFEPYAKGIFMSKKLIISFVYILLCVNIQCLASSIDVIVDGVKYRCENEEATVIGSSEKQDSVFVKDIVNIDNFEYTVTSITNLRHPSFVHLPNTITRIEEDAFGDLKSINIPSSVKYIGKDAFWWGFGKLSKIEIDDISAWCDIEFANIGANPFWANYYDFLHSPTYLYINGEKTIDLIIPDDVTIIKEYAFCGYEYLESVQFPEALESIQPDAFQDCNNLETVIIPNSTRFIENGAFNGSGLKSVTLGNNIEEIGYSAFNYTKIDNVNCYAVNPPIIYESTFPSQVEYDGTLHIPKGTMSQYLESPYWSRFNLLIDDLEYIDNVEEMISYQNYPVVISSLYGQFCGTEINELKKGIYIIKSDCSVKKIYIH